MVSDPPVPHLTPKEIEVLQGIASSKSSQQIALELNIAYWTVQQHRRSIASKIAYGRKGMVHNNIAALTRFAVGQGLVEIESEWKKPA